MQTTIYVAGPISNMPNLNKKAFAKTTKKLRKHGFIVFNPHELCKGIPAKKWKKCMRICIKKLMDADMVVLLDGWDKSRGASIENNLATAIGIPCILVAEILEVFG